MGDGTLPNEEAAEHKTNISGWVCKTCRRFYGDEAGSERTARYCCEKDHACGTDGCAGRAIRPWIFCGACKEKRALDLWLSRPEVDWDGETPLVLDDDDEYFFSPEDLDEYLADHHLKPEDIRLVIAVLDRKPHFDMHEFVSDYLPEDLEADDDVKINAIVNKWIQKHVPDVWVPGKNRPTMDSISASFIHKEEAT